MSKLNKKYHKALDITEPYVEDPIDAEKLYSESEADVARYYKTADIKVNRACDKFFENWGFAFNGNPIIEKAIKRLAYNMYELGSADGYADGFRDGENKGYVTFWPYYW